MNEKLEDFALEFSEYLLSRAKNIEDGKTRDEVLINKGRLLECSDTVKAFRDMVYKYQILQQV